MLENFSAGAFERMGFGFDKLRELNPNIIYISISGFGHAGIDTTYITWGPTAQAVSGSTAMSGFPDMPPAGWGYSYLDHTAGYYGAIGLIQALYHRKKTGQGQYVDVEAAWRRRRIDVWPRWSIGRTNTWRPSAAGWWRMPRPHRGG